jgi:hypothetical protein
MGLKLGLSLGSSASVSSSAVLRTHYKYDEEYFSLEEVNDVMVKYSPSNYFRPVPHTFIECRTTAGHLFRFDYSATGTTAEYQYIGSFDSKLLKAGKAVPRTTVKRAKKIFEKHAKKQEYSLLKHNCSSVSNDFYDEVTGNDAVNLAAEFKEIVVENHKMFSKNSNHYRNFAIRFARPYFCDIMMKGLKTGKTKEDIEKIFEETRRSNSLDNVINTYRKIVQNSEEDYKTWANLSLKQHEFNDFLYKSFAIKMKIINNNWTWLREIEDSPSF